MEIKLELPNKDLVSCNFYNSFLNFTHPIFGTLCYDEMILIKDSKNQILLNKTDNLLSGKSTINDLLEFWSTRNLPVHLGYRPMTKLSSILPHATYVQKDDAGKIYAIFFGEYPQYRCDDKRLNSTLDSLYNKEALLKTGKVYRNVDGTELTEYVYEGKKYVQIFEDTLKAYYWVKVTPVRWFVDEKSEYAITQEIIQMTNNLVNANLDNLLENSEKYLNECLLKDLIPSVLTKEQQEESKTQQTLNQTEEAKFQDENLSKQQKFGFFSRIFGKREEEVVEETSEVTSPQELETTPKEEVLGKQNVLSSLIEEIEYSLLNLQKVDEELYNKCNEEFQRILASSNSEDCKFALAALAGKIEFHLNFGKKSAKDLIEYLDKLKQEYLNNFIFDGENKKTDVTLENLDKITGTFFSKAEEYDVLEQRNVIKKLAFAYLMVVKENIDFITVERLNNSYFKKILKSILYVIEALKSEGLIANNVLIDINEITVENILEIIRTIQFTKVSKEEKERVENVMKSA